MGRGVWKKGNIRCLQRSYSYQEPCSERDFTLHFGVCSKGNSSLLPCPVVVVYAPGIKVSLVQEKNSADGPWFYNRNNLQLAADTVSSVLWWQTTDLLLNICPKEFFKTKQCRAICSACEGFIACGKVRLLQGYTHCKHENLHFREQTLAYRGWLSCLYSANLSSILPHRLG